MWEQKMKVAVLGMSLAALTACGTPMQDTSQSYPAARTAAATSTGYGVVQSIDVVPRERAGSGLGTAAGAVLGGVLGNQIGSGTGRTAATVAGVAGGALAGRALEQRQAQAGEVYRVSILMDNGAMQTMVQETPPGLRVGERVRLSNGVIVERYQ